MRKGVVTVVLPIYNVEKYLERCLKSVVNQTYRNLEIILVDDGSPDKCPDICDEWAKKDKRIKVIHKKNAGLGFARNTGIENATGEYICFFDSDDYVALDTIEKCYLAAIKENADIVTYGFCNVQSDGRTTQIHIPCTSKNVYTGEEVQSYILPNMVAPNTETGEITNLWMSMCGALFSMELINRTDWRLVSEREIISEDIYSLLRLYKDVKRVVVIPESLYFYCVNLTSLTHKYREDRFEKIKYFYNECIKVCNEYGYDEKVKQQLSYPFISNIIAALKIIVNSDIDKNKRRQIIKNILNDNELQKIVSRQTLIHEKWTRKALILCIEKKHYKLVETMIKIKS